MCCHLVPRKTNVDRLAVDWRVNNLIEQSHALLKVSHQRLKIRGIACIEPDDQPLLCCQIERADRQAEHPLPVGKGCLILLDASPTIQLFGAGGNRDEFFPYPLVRWCKWVCPPPIVNGPGAQEKIEIGDVRHVDVLLPSMTLQLQYTCLCGQNWSSLRGIPDAQRGILRTPSMLFRCICSLHILWALPARCSIKLD